MSFESLVQESHSKFCYQPKWQRYLGRPQDHDRLLGLRFGRLMMTTTTNVCFKARQILLRYI